jgi:hypothetical protein
MRIDERLRRAALRWGALGLIAQLYFAVGFLGDGLNELHRWTTLIGTATIKDRMSQMKPAAFKFPFTGIYLSIFAIIAVIVVIALFYVGFKEAFGARADSSSTSE